MMFRDIPERTGFVIMIAVLGAVLFLTGSDADFPSREVYLRSTLQQALNYVPPNDVEAWLGWRRIYTGENVFPNMAIWKLSVKFRAPSGRLSTVVKMLPLGTRSTCFEWVTVNVPGGDVSRGDDLLPHRPDLYTIGTLTLLVFPQNQRLDSDAAGQSLEALQGCDVDSFQAALQLDRADAITAYKITYYNCGDQENPDEDTPNWDVLKGNLEKISYYSLFGTPPPGVLEVEYLEGVSLRMGNCIPVFLTLSPPRSLKFAAAAGTYYTLCFVDLGTEISHSCNWLLVNIPESDFSRGVQVVPYSLYTNDSRRTAECVYLLYSQGKKEMAVSEVRKLSPPTPKDISDKLNLGDPVAANFFLAYWAWGPPPGRHPPVPSTGLLMSSPVQDLSSTSRVPLAPTVPLTLRLPSTAQVVTTTQKALATLTGTIGSSSTVLIGTLCVVVTGLLILFQVMVPALDYL